MWAAILQRANQTVVNTLKDCAVVLDPDGIASACFGIFDAPHQEVAEGPEGPALGTVDPAVTFVLEDLDRDPVTRDILTVAVQNPDGTHETAVRYRVGETMRDGHGKMTAQLIKAET